jgi:hypothetical protein
VNRQIDRLIAEHVFGYCVAELNGKPYVTSAPDEFMRAPVQHYSSDIAMAWLVVERISQPSATSANTLFMFWWRKADLWADTGPDAAHAICLAALTALGVPYE